MSENQMRYVMERHMAYFITSHCMQPMHRPFDLYMRIVEVLENVMKSFTCPKFINHSQVLPLLVVGLSILETLYSALLTMRSRTFFKQMPKKGWNLHTALPLFSEARKYCVVEEVEVLLNFQITRPKIEKFSQVMMNLHLKFKRLKEYLDRRIRLSM